MSDGERIWLGTLLEEVSGRIQAGEPLHDLQRDVQVVVALAATQTPEGLYDVACGLRRLVERAESLPEQQKRQELDALLVRFGMLSPDQRQQIST